MTTDAVGADAAHRIGPRRLLTLLGGRATFRLLLYVSAGVLVAAWSREDFNVYAAAVGAAGWLAMVVQSGPEKAALTLIPRARRTRDQLIGPLRAIVGYVPPPFAAAGAVAFALAPDSAVTVYLLAIAYYISLGCGMLGVALHRALGGYGRDTVHFSLLGLGMIGMAGLAFTAGIGPAGYLAGLVALMTVLNIALLRGLPRGSGARPRRAVRRLLAGTVALMGAADVMANAIVGTLFVELALTSHAGQSGDLYLMILGWGFATSVVYTVQRIYQPRLALRMVSPDAPEARALARRIAGLAVWGSAVWLVLAGAALAGGLAGTRSLVALGVLMATLLPANALAGFGIFVLENAGGTGLRGSALAVVLAWAVVAALGALVIPLAGAAGAVYALGAQGLVLGLALRRRM
ncbi:hypothetical protein [Nonomuraea cavernae]|uniref:Membrane protein involved in the export of O-antigen and teichoic acid n=1 Tax=Nonomuraea cavernae TaxID=2045107 RepID=A0A917ZDG6_9ACTN|nr:hypothetical protein [Nonomuraea cavernae]MCA2190380.1 hypothetical protein [Nonomuraea cavernae]GGO80813.1 hypothetical protein GCM10012289_68330 [Nonomuraea cavernae]